MRKNAMPRYEECLTCKMSLFCFSGLNPLIGEKCSECKLVHVTSRNFNLNALVLRSSISDAAYSILEHCVRKHAVLIDMCDLCIPY